MDTQTILFFSILVAVVAFLYASVGHGGASGYLALMALFGFSPLLMKPSALLLNICVSLIAFFQFYRKGYFRWSLFWPFAIASIPLSYAGSLIPLDDSLYKKILGVLLIFPVIRLMMPGYSKSQEEKELQLIPALIAGACIGLLSGMIGIGGGIILSPLILILRWGNMKQTAAVSALFIFVNSVTGLIGTGTGQLFQNTELLVWVSLALMGGVVGSYAGSTTISQVKLKYPLALVLVIACIKLLTV